MSKFVIVAPDGKEELLAVDTPAGPDAVAPKVGAGLLGFSNHKTMSRGDYAYLQALGLSKEDIKLLLHDLRDGLSPLTR